MNDVLAQLLNAFNKAWLSGVVPASFPASTNDAASRKAIPVIKPSKPAMALKNLWLISLMPSFFKLARKMPAAQLSWWLEQHGYYHPVQISFCPSLATEDGLSIYNQPCHQSAVMAHGPSQQWTYKKPMTSVKQLSGLD